MEMLLMAHSGRCWPILLIAMFKFPVGWLRRSQFLSMDRGDLR